MPFSLKCCASLIELYIEDQILWVPSQFIFISNDSQYFNFGSWFRIDTSSFVFGQRTTIQNLSRRLWTVHLWYWVKKTIWFIYAVYDFCLLSNFTERHLFYVTFFRQMFDGRKKLKLYRLQDNKWNKPINKRIVRYHERCRFFV